NGKAAVMAMGCYGIGISRVVAAAIEQNHDDAGIIWPDAMQGALFGTHLLDEGAEAGSTDLVTQRIGIAGRGLWSSHQPIPATSTSPRLATSTVGVLSGQAQMATA
ncbi:hypothetical protein, partial [Stenotrophomonas sp. 3diitr2024]|uniref:hypothetical protein n=1 Tax=Stenotrophomonas sp. 3diitr2024 TaxID=3345115 RepID=UPI0035CA159E